MVIFETRHLTVSGGQFSWGGNLPKRNGGVQTLISYLLSLIFYLSLKLLKSIRYFACPLYKY